MNLEEVTQLYELGNVLVVSRELVDETVVDEFTVESRALESVLGDAAKEEPWNTALRPLRRARWLVHTIPLATDAEALGLRALATELAVRTRGLRIGSSEETVYRLDLAGSLLTRLVSESHAALANAVLNLLRIGADPQATVVIHSEPLQPAVVRAFKTDGSVPPVRVLTPAQMKTTAAHATQLVVGASRHFPDWIFNAPRAETITIVQLASAADRAGIPMLLAGTSKLIPVRGQVAKGLSSSEYLVDPPAIDWGALHAAEPIDQIVSVKARAYLLAANRSVLLEAADAATVFVVQPDLRGTEIIGRLPTSSVEQGDFLLLRETFGNDDLIAQTANRILKKKAEPLRAQQARWKRVLRQRVEQDGLVAAYEALAEGGCRAKNLPRWLGPDGIRTKSRSDFAVICRYAGIQEIEVERLWNAMGEIHSAHVKAGSKVRELLEKQLRETDLSELKSTGYVKVELTGENAGSLGVFRVEAKDPTTRMAHPRALRIAYRYGTA